MSHAAPAPGPDFAAMLGLQTTQAGRLRMTVEAAHGTGQGAAHGGVLTTFAQVALERHLESHAEISSGGGVSLNCDFLALVPVGATLEARVEITRRTRSIIFLSADIVMVETDPECSVLSATALWRA